MVVVDSSVWIDFFNGVATAERTTLRRLLQQGETEIIVPDLVLYEVLRGFRSERDYLQASHLMSALSVEPTVDPDRAGRAASHYRSLRAGGITVRSPIDVLVATFCIDGDHVLLHRDRDFNAFAELRGLRVWPHPRVR